MLFGSNESILLLVYLLLIDVNSPCNVDGSVVVQGAFVVDWTLAALFLIFVIFLTVLSIIGGILTNPTHLGVVVEFSPLFN